MIKKIKGFYRRLEYKIESFSWMKVFFSPFKSPKMKIHIGRIKIGIPYFYPRRWVKNKEGSNFRAIPKKIGFDFVPLGWKTKWNNKDYRFEYSPIWSFVFFKWQIAILWIAPENNFFWECWLYYSRNTDKKKDVKERIIDVRNEFPCIWKNYANDTHQKICYWDLILKPKYLLNV